MRRRKQKHCACNGRPCVCTPAVAIQWAQQQLAASDPRAPFPVNGAAARPPVGSWERQVPLFDPTPYHPNASKLDEAAARIAASLGPRARSVFEYVRRCGPLGATCAEAEIACNLRNQQCSPRFVELAAAGLIVDSGKKRSTQTGRRAVVYVVRGTKLARGRR